MSLLRPNWQEILGSKISTDWENAPEHGSFILSVSIKGEDIKGHMKSMGDRSGRWKKAKWGNLRIR